MDSEKDYIQEGLRQIRSNIGKDSFKVLILSIPLSIPSGAAIMPQRLFYGLLRAGIDARVISHWWDCGFEPLIRYSLISKDDYTTFFRTNDMKGNRIAKVEKWRVVNTPEGKKKIPAKIKPLVSRYQMIRTGRELIMEIFRHLSNSGYRPDIIHVNTHTFTYDGTFNEICRLFGNPPVVYTLHAVIKEISRQREMAQKETLDNADSVVTISDGWRKLIQKTYKIKCDYIHNSTDYTPFSEDRNVKKRAMELYNALNPNGSKLLLFSGRVEEIKILGFAKAFSEIADKQDVKLIIIGDPGGEITLKNLIKWGLKEEHLDRVIFIGWVNGISEAGRREMAAYYKMMHINEETPNGAVVMPVRTEDHYGLSVLDAVAMKVPVITCKGKLATSGCLPDPDSLKEAIEFVFSNPDEVKKRIDNSYQILKKEYSVDGYYVPKHLSLYRELIDKIKHDKKIDIVKKREQERRKKIIETVRKREEERRRNIMKKVANREKKVQ